MFQILMVVFRHDEISVFPLVQRFVEPPIDLIRMRVEYNNVHANFIVKINLIAAEALKGAPHQDGLEWWNECIVRVAKCSTTE